MPTISSQKLVGGPLPNNITLFSTDDLGALDQLPGKVHEGSDELHGVVGEEVLRTEGGSEGCVSVGVHDDGVKDKGYPGTVRLEVAKVRHLLSVNALHLTSAVVEEEGDVHGDVVHNASTGNESEEDAQSLGRAAVELKECKQREDHGNSKTPDRDTVLSGLSEEGRRTTFECETVQRAGSAVCVGVAGRKDGREEQGVHDVRQNINTEVGHSNNPRRGSSSTTTLSSAEVNANESRVLVVKNNTASQGSTNKENTKSGVDCLECSLDIYAGVLRLGGDHRDIVRANDVKGGGGQSAHKPFEASKVTIGSSNDFEGDQESLVEEEVPSDHETQSIVDPVASETDETTRDRHISVHLSDRVVGETEDHGVESSADEKTTGATLGETGADTDEETSTNGTSHSKKLNLTVVETAMKTIGVVSLIAANGALRPLGGLFVGGHVGEVSAELLWC
ncbi:hypothetical protein HG530_013241 [Fusarium avenaceum]|nr:hypothetical protein HG530_013241 [Fusarium avenaceum]